MGELPADVSIAEAIAAFHTVEAFWVALSNDDDRAARLLIAPPALAKYAWTTQGLARQVRATLGVTTGQCASMGTSNRVRILAGGELAFWSMPVWHDTLIDAPTLVAGWGWQVEQTGDGSWQLLQMPDSGDLRAAPQFSLPEGTEAEALVASEKAKPARAKAAARPSRAAAAGAANDPIEAEVPVVAAAPVVAPVAEARAEREPVAIPVERSSAPDALPVAVPVERQPAREAIPTGVRVGATRAVARVDALPVARPARKTADDEPRTQVQARVQVEPAPVVAPAPVAEPAPLVAPLPDVAPAPAVVAAPIAALIASTPSSVAARQAEIDRAAGLPPEPLSPLAVRRILGLPEQKARRSHRARVLGASFIFGFVAALGIVLTVGSQLRH
jgi:hypothetical protein